MALKGLRTHGKGGQLWETKWSSALVSFSHQENHHFCFQVRAIISYRKSSSVQKIVAMHDATGSSMELRVMSICPGSLPIHGMVLSEPAGGWESGSRQVAQCQDASLRCTSVPVPVKIKQLCLCFIKKCIFLCVIPTATLLSHTNSAIPCNVMPVYPHGNQRTKNWNRCIGLHSKCKTSGNLHT